MQWRLVQLLGFLFLVTYVAADELLGDDVRFLEEKPSYETI